jgi:hypothetical protein
MLARCISGRPSSPSWSQFRPGMLFKRPGMSQNSRESSQVKLTERYSEITVIRNVMSPGMSLERLESIRIECCDLRYCKSRSN